MFRRPALLGAVVLFLVVVVNIVYGKVAVLQGATTTPGLGDVGEFLVLLAAVVLFIAACLRQEREKDAEQDQESRD